MEILKTILGKLCTPLPERKSPRVVKGKHSPWLAGSLLAYRITSSRDLTNHPLWGKYALLRVVKVQRQPVSVIAPTIAYDESIVLGVYGWAGDFIPEKAVIDSIDYIPFSHREPPLKADDLIIESIARKFEDSGEYFRRILTERVVETCILVSHYYFQEMKKVVTMIDCDNTFEKTIPSFFNTDITACLFGNPRAIDHRLTNILLKYYRGHG